PLPADWTTTTVDSLEWQRVLETSPCLPPSETRNVFGGNQAGGRIVAAPRGGIFFTTGEFEFDGLEGKLPIVSQTEGSSYGRVLHIDSGGAVTEISRGHRNPQGVAIDGRSRLWSAEQGPMGGDEV